MTELPRPVAAIDLGSNSFHMIIASEVDGEIRIVDRVKEMVRLNEGLDKNMILSPDVQQRALDCLERFAQRISPISADRIRAVGTNTLRAAHNADEFMTKAESALGHNISIISGHEEARLVYLGAEFGHSSSGRKRLVVDIGGGSTELIIGDTGQPKIMDSLYMGCVSLSRLYFSDGVINHKNLSLARSHALRELEPVTQQYKKAGWQETIGTSGTIKAIDSVSRKLGLENDFLSRESFELIQHWLIECRESHYLSHIPEQRRPVFAGGFSILQAIFEFLDIDRMEVSDGALREGVMLELIGRLQDRDSREAGISRVANQFQVDLAQSERVTTTAMIIFGQSWENWGLSQLVYRKLIAWSSCVHEIGVSVAYNQHHKHSQYILENANIDGFSRQVQRILALIVRCHRQKFPQTEWSSLPEEWKMPVLYLSVVLRVSAAINRNRKDQVLSNISFTSSTMSLVIHVTESWSNDHPMTMMDLDIESKYLQDIGFSLTVSVKN